MLKAILYFFIIFTALSCKNKKSDQKAIKQTIKIKKTEKTKSSYNLITNKNVVERLTNYGKKNPETIADIYTSKGKITIELFKDTPLHRANFILYAKSGYFNHCLFSRVVKNFMAQCGGSYDEKQKTIQDTIGIYTIPSEMSHHHFHKKGSLASARSYTNNPKKRSECDEFYFIEGRKFSDLSLDNYEKENNYTYTKTQRKYYKNNAGAAHIDGEHTVFGKIIKGFNVIPKLTNVDTDSQDWPVVDIYIDSVIVLR